MSVEVSVGYMSVGWACVRARKGGALGERPNGEGVEWEEREGGEGSGSGRGGVSSQTGRPPSTARGGGPFGLESLYRSAPRRPGRAKQEAPGRGRAAVLQLNLK
jgi:hypothetical protein